MASLIRYNMWQMGKKKIMPRVARDLYVTDSVTPLMTIDDH